jgi:hypothetical protein
MTRMSANSMCQTRTCLALKVLHSTQLLNGFKWAGTAMKVDDETYADLTRSDSSPGLTAVRGRFPVS